LYLTLKKLKAENLAVYIPNRLHEGYGMNKEAVAELKKNGTELIITVDCGITNLAEVELAKQSGIKVIVTDHHLTGTELPAAEAIICPTVKTETYPNKNLAGVGVAFKLAQALLKNDEQNNDAFEKWLLDLVAIGTVADCVPLIGENRTLVKWGLLVLGKTQRLGLREMMASAKISAPLSTFNIAFQIAPRLNAAGRMDHANTAFELLITNDEAEAIAICNELNEKNQLRQKTTGAMLNIAEEQIGVPDDNDKILFSVFDGWSPGLVGLVAGKLSEKWHRPVLVMGKMGEEYIGSGRSVEEFDITAALQECQEYLKSFGGHREACGLTIQGEDNYKNFLVKIKKIAGEKLKGVELSPNIMIEAEIDFEEASWALIDELNKFEPFGEENNEPLFMTSQLKVLEVATMGANKQHLRMQLTQEKNKIRRKFVAFRGAEKWANKLKVGDEVDAAYNLAVNEWNGNREIEMRVADIKQNF